MSASVARRRAFGLSSATALVVANMIGAGVFTTSGFALHDLGSRGQVMAAWLLGGLIALCGALSYGALVRRMAESGGEYLFEFGQAGFGPGDFRDPNRVRVAGDGTVWVSDLVQGRLSHFDAEGRFIDAVERLQLIAPHGFAFAADGRLYIGDTGNGVVKVLAPRDS